MASESESGGGGGGFGWGFLIGGALGVLAGAYLASGPGRDQVDSLRTRTIELTGGGDEIRARARTAAEKARTAVSDPRHPMRKAINEGITAARRRRQELDQAAEAPTDGLGEGGATVLGEPGAGAREAD